MAEAQAAESPSAGIGARIAEVVATERLTQAQFAERLNVSGSFVSEVLRGKKLPGTELLLALRQEFRVSIDWVLTGEGSMSGAEPLDLDMLQTVLALVRLATAAEVERTPEARALAAALSGRGEVSEAQRKQWARLIGSVATSNADAMLAAVIYNSQIWTTDPRERVRNALASAIASIRRSSSSSIFDAIVGKQGVKPTAVQQSNRGKNVRAAAGDYIEHYQASASSTSPQGRRRR